MSVQSTCLGMKTSISDACANSHPVVTAAETYEGNETTKYFANSTIELQYKRNTERGSLQQRMQARAPNVGAAVDQARVECDQGARQRAAAQPQPRARLRVVHARRRHMQRKAQARLNRQRIVSAHTTASRWSMPDGATCSATPGMP